MLSVWFWLLCIFFASGILQEGGGIIDVLPKDAIPAIFDPDFVGPEEADMSDNAVVIGVEIKGDARAYSLNLLNGHEIVNDTVGGVPVAVTW